MLLRKLIILYFLSFFVNYSIAQNGTNISGRVNDENGKPLPYVNVYLLGTLEGGVSDEQGNFEFNSNIKGKVTLIASMIGYEKYEDSFVINGDEIKIKITLEREAIQLDEALVLGSSFSSEKEKGLVISKQDVYTTPGGAADIFQSIKALPGLTQVSESAQLYVRGGDPIETAMLIDQASVYHPYTYESAYGGLFSNLNSAAVKGLYFSSGGFSARYGNVLSGVLDISTVDEPVNNSFNLGISMAAASISMRIPVVDQKLGINIFANQSFTKPILWLNGTSDEFTAAPTSRDVTSSIIYKYSQTGRIKILGLFAEDKQGVKVDRADYQGTYNGNSSNMLFNILQTDIIFHDLLIKNSLSVNSHKNNMKLGILDLNIGDAVLKLRSDFEKHVSRKIKLLSGFESEVREKTFRGTIPSEDFDIRPDGLGDKIDSEIISARFGVYAETEISDIFGIADLSSITGLRFDAVPALNVNWIDPRFAIGYKLDNNTILKFGFGIFHQLPDARLFSESDGNPNLIEMEAVHYILSIDRKFTKYSSLRLEAYHKNYFNLPLEDKIFNYTNGGYGFANGIDFILKGKLPPGFEGWISYGFIDTKRKWMDYDSFTMSDFDITHQLSLILKYNISAMWQIGINYKLTTGRPYTPITSSNFISDLNIYKPVYGSTNSGRYPTYKRLDFRITHFNRLFGSYFTVFYLEALNILNINNIFGYSYDPTYTVKREIRSYFGRRTLVFGMSVNFQ